mmetsp:Transcript_14875/g.18252  ORF Transcript_14875/g.18252 Transcript_14875/m.18252 type:complete len:85 (-) Transcript_14875:865-1119(-)
MLSRLISLLLVLVLLLSVSDAGYYRYGGKGRFFGKGYRYGYRRFYGKGYGYRGYRGYSRFGKGKGRFYSRYSDSDDSMGSTDSH